MGFGMARALIKRARERAEWIGDDHGDPYEQALVSRKISDEFQICVKEILDHLRSALDYVARACVGGTVSVKVYFPIIRKGGAEKDFRSVVARLMPGVLEARPEILPILASFQPFSHPENGWLADLATLANETKHVQLTVNEVTTGSTKFYRGTDGQMMISMRKSDGRPFTRLPLMLLESLPTDGEGETRSVYLALMPIDEELLYFLRTALSGVENIVDKLEAAMKAKAAMSVDSGS